MDKPSNSSLRELAVSRILRLFSGELSPEEEREIGAWPKESVEYQQEFLNTAHLLADMEALGDSAAIREILQDEVWYESGVGDKAREYRGLWTTVAIAASLILGVFLGFEFYTGSASDTKVLRYVTGIGEQKTVNLADGSNITLNTSSELLVNFSSQVRQVILVRGEAYFDVAKDSASGRTVRPFSVDIGPRRVSVLGTQFSIRKRPDAFTLAVVEGEVALHQAMEQADVNALLISATAAQTVQLDAPGQRRFTAGWVAEYDEEKNRLTAFVSSDLESLYSWRTGVISFSGEPLYKVIQELNRYSAKKILIEDIAAMDISVNAGFRVDQVNTALAGLERAYPVNVIHDFDRIIIKRKKE